MSPRKARLTIYDRLAGPQAAPIRIIFDVRERPIAVGRYTAINDRFAALSVDGTTSTSPAD